MSKKKETEIDKNPILEKAIELGFEKEKDCSKKINFQLPFGLSNYLSLNFKYDNHLTLDIENFSHIIEIRKIESPEDLENLFNAI